MRHRTGPESEFERTRVGGGLCAVLTSHSLQQLDFSQDEAYTASCAKYVFQKHGMEHLGMARGASSGISETRSLGTWHSHHQLGLPRPSSGDDHTFFEGLQNNKVLLSCALWFCLSFSALSL